MKASWSARPLGELARFCGGGTPSKSNAAFWSGDIPWVSPKDMWVDEVTTSFDMISDEAIRSSATAMIPVGSILCVVRSGILARKFPVAITRRSVAINQDLKAIIPSRSVSAEYLFYFLKASELKILAGVTTGATVHRLSTDLLRKMDVPVPPLDEQRRIVAVLDQAFTGIATATANAQNNLTNARALFESYANGAFEEVALTAVRPLLETLTVVKSGITYGVVKPGDTGSIPFVRGGDLIGGKVRLDRLRTITSQVSEQYSRTLLRGGELLMCLVGVPGQCAIAPAELAGANIARQVGLIRLRSDVNAEYVKDYLQSPPGQKSLGTFTGGSVQQVINLGDLRQVEIPLPERSTQDQMVKRLATVKQLSDEVAQRHRAKLDALTELKQSLLQKAFAGELS